MEHHKKIFYTYILFSPVKKHYYYGCTGDLTKRVRDHNNGKVRSTKSGRPWFLYYFETYQTKVDALKRELYFKSIEGYNYLKENGVIKRNL